MIPEEKFTKEEEKNLQKKDPEKKSENAQNKSWNLNKKWGFGGEPHYSCEYLNHLHLMDETKIQKRKE